jgi:hypothetical protein
VTVEYVGLVDYLAVAAEVTGLDTDTVARVAKVHLADSALHAPAAGFGDCDARAAQGPVGGSVWWELAPPPSRALSRR